MKKSLFFILFGLLFCSVGYADDSAIKEYYASVEGKSGAELKTALNKIIKNHVDVGYGGLYEVYETSDDRDGKVWDMYSTCTWTHGNKHCGNYSNVCDCHNREHVVPQSWFDERSPMKSDAFHVYPTDGKVNGMRSNHPHGETNASAIGGKALGKLGSCSVSGYSGTVYEPVDEYKGDIARTYFYFVTCYEDRLSSFDVNAVLTGETYPSLKPWFYNLMLKWHRNDPVSQKEIDRNNAIYEHQENRNPFIDYPEMVEHIWGNKKNEDFSFEPVSGEGGTTDCEDLNVNLLQTGFDGFVAYSIKGDRNWYWDSNYNYAKMSGYVDGTSYANEDWLISEPFDLSQMQSADISFTHIINFAVDMASEQTVWVSNDYEQGTNPSDVTWTQLKGFTYPDGKSWKKAESGKIVVPAKYLTDNVVFAFKYTSTTSGAATWEVMNFQLNGVCKDNVSSDIVNVVERTVFVDEGVVYISDLAGENVVVYDLWGKMICSVTADAPNLELRLENRGIYLLKIGEDIVKVAY